MFVDFATLKKIVPHVIRAKLPILIRAKHGVGKSELVKEFDKDIAEILYPNKEDRIKAYGSADYVYPIVERRASQMADAGDLMGLPFQEGETTQFKPMKWFYEACIKPCLLFVDEVDRGNQEVRQAFFEMTDSRKIAGHALHPDTIIFACVNGGIGDNSYQVGDMDPAELSRWTVFDAKPSVGDWLDWGKNRMSVQVWDFIKQNNGMLEHNGEFEPNKVYPSRRSWARFNKSVADTDLLDCANEKEKSMILFHLADGFLGNETAVAFQDFCKNFKKQVSVEDILIRGDFRVARKLEINQHMALIDKFGEHEIFRKPMADFNADGTVKQNHKAMDNLAQYLLIVQPELAMKIWEISTRFCPQNGIALHASVVNGQSISDYLAKLNGAES